ncbi:MAG: serine/threonine protein kinase [Oscillatoria princeps RMCB-10]|jgi:serine/threonine protein kinase|nr:serine/threonine protein kinase [Oscillatoria princeps RMCB-10]
MLQAGQVLHDRYKLKQKLGQNAGRQTWLAEDLTAQPAGEPVIVKLLSFGGDVQWDDLKLFEREAQVLKQLSHPRIPKYRDYFSIDDRTLWFGLVQEYIPGSSFKELLNQGIKFTEKELRKIAEEILKILVYLHELNPPVLHRDIKPSNLIWGEDKRVYLVDFGAVQDKAAAEGATFTVVGTYGYAPVEQFGGRAVPASDLYALGATLIHLATGTSPADLPQRDMRIQFSDRVSLSPSFASWIGHLTEPALERRFISAGEALAALQSGFTAQSSSQLTNSPHTGKILPPTGSQPLEAVDPEGFSACVAKTIPQPSNSSVRLKKSHKKLSIEMPFRWSLLRFMFANNKKVLVTLSTIYAFFMVSNFFILLISGFFRGASLEFIIWIGLAFPLLECMHGFLGALAIFGSIGIVDGLVNMLIPTKNFRAVFQRKVFTLEWYCWGFCYSQQQERTADIQNVLKSVIEISPSVEKPIVEIHTSQQEYSFGQGLTEAECAWLAQEIQTWLNLK